MSAASENSVTITFQPGWDIFEPAAGKCDYRYGPSMIVNPDASLEAWFASTGGPNSRGMHEWDWIRYRRSSDGGQTWTPEQVVLRPTEGSRDRMSVCDPGVVRFGGRYCIGYTAVDNEKGNCNEIFVARSNSPTGPFEKWNGRGWGGEPTPMIPFREPADVWGAGEPSFVVKDGTVLVYYTWNSRDEDGRAINETRVATAPADDADWPGRLTHHGRAYDRVQGEDSADVKYCDAGGRFVAIASAKRFTDASYIAVRESTDGLHFGPPTDLTRHIQPRCHNAGISGMAEGHLDPASQNVIAYAYSKSREQEWGCWHTHLHPIILTLP